MSNQRIENEIKNTLSNYNNNPKLIEENKQTVKKIYDDLLPEQERISKSTHRWIFIKMDNYLSAMENLIDNNSKREAYLIIDKNNIVLDYNRELCNNKIRKGLRVCEATELDKNIIKLIKYNPSRYSEFQKKLLKELYKYDKFLEVKAYDEYLLNITKFCSMNYCDGIREIAITLKTIIDKLEADYKIIAYIGFSQNQVLATLLCFRAIKLEKLFYEKNAIQSNSKKSTVNPNPSSINNNNKNIQKCIRYYFFFPFSKENINNFLSTYSIEDIPKTMLGEYTIIKLSVIGVKVIFDIIKYSDVILYLCKGASNFLFCLSLGLGYNSYQTIKEEKPLVFQSSLNDSDNPEEVFNKLLDEFANNFDENNCYGKSLISELIDENNQKYIKNIILYIKTQKKSEIVSSMKEHFNQIMETYKVKKLKSIMLMIKEASEEEKNNKIDKYCGGNINTQASKDKGKLNETKNCIKTEKNLEKKSSSKNELNINSQKGVSKNILKQSKSTNSVFNNNKIKNELNKKGKRRGKTKNKQSYGNSIDSFLLMNKK